MPEEHPAYTTTYHSMTGLKAVLMSWEEGFGYTPWMTGPSFSNPENSRQWAKEWAKAEEIEYKP